MTSPTPTPASAVTMAPPPPSPPGTASSSNRPAPAPLLRGPAPPLDFAYHQESGFVVFKVVNGDPTGASAVRVKGHDRQPLAFDKGLLRVPGRAGESLIVEISRDGVLQQKLPVRVLTRAEEAEVGRLLADSTLAHAAIIVDRLDQLGLPFLAARRADSLLLELDDQDAGLLTYLYDLYTHKLHDAAKADRVRQRAAEIGLTLP